MKKVDLRDMFTKAYRSARTSTIVLSLDLLSPAPSTSLVMKTAKYAEEDPNDPHTADEGDNQTECASD
jgi:hypothetical protein